MITESDLQGHWRRDWITAPGYEDRTTRVHWMQAGALFADLRVPAQRPDLVGRDCLADLSPSELVVLMQAEGFAGTIEVSHSQCTWRRAINWHGVPEADDIGQMSFDGQALIEDGVLATYRERWLCEPTTHLRGHQIALDNMQGVLIENDDVFLVGLGPVPQGTSMPLQAALERGDTPDLHPHFASTYCLGHWDGAAGIATLSTNPFCEGRMVLHRDAPFTWHAPGFDGQAGNRLLGILRTTEMQHAH